MKRVGLVAITGLVVLGLWLLGGGGRSEIGAGVPDAAQGETEREQDALDPVYREEPASPPGGARVTVEVESEAAELEDPRSVRASGSVEGQLVDLFTRAPIAFAPVRITSADETIALEETAKTDDGGHFVAQGAVESGRLLVELSEGDFASFVEINHVPPFPPKVIPVRVGPTYSLILDSPSGVDLASLRATIRGREDKSAEVPLRFEGGTWVRFPWRPMFEKESPPWTLELASEDGVWSGRAQVRQILGVQREPVHIHIGIPGSLAGRLIDDTGEDIGVPAALRLTSPDGEQLWLGGIEEEYELTVLTPGTWTIVATASGFGEELLSTEVLSGAETTLDIVFDERLARGAVSGRVEVPAGHNLDGVKVALDNGEGTFEAEPLPDGSFVFDDVVAGLCWVYAMPENIPTLLGADAELNAPASGIVLSLRPRVDPKATLLTYAIFARDAASDAPVVPVRASMAHPGRGVSMWTYDSTVTFSLIPEGEHFAWDLLVEGYLPERGDETRFPSWKRGDPLPIPLTLNLRPGWGALIHAVDATGSSIPGVPVRLDGDLAGTTDADGLLDVVRSKRPLEVSVGGGWKLDWGGDVHPESGAFGSPFPEMRLIVKRP